MLSIGDRVGLIACSNALPTSDEAVIGQLIRLLEGIGLRPVPSRSLYQTEAACAASARQRAEAFMRFYTDQSVKAIFDLSGGDLANGVLEYLDYDFLQSHPKPFWGYSDLTTVLNALYQKCGARSYLYQVKNIVYDNSGKQLALFKNAVLDHEQELYQLRPVFHQGSAMKGVMIGGNLRCLLKLAGTSYMPSFKGKLLLLESYGGSFAQVAAYLRQLKHMQVFQQIAGLLLGTFTKLEKQGPASQLIDLALSIIDQPSLPVAKTSDIGHHITSKCVVVGKEYSFFRQ